MPETSREISSLKPKITDKLTSTDYTPIPPYIPEEGPVAVDLGIEDVPEGEDITDEISGTEEVAEETENSEVAEEAENPAETELTEDTETTEENQ